MIHINRKNDNPELLDTMLDTLLMGFTWLLRNTWTLFLRLLKLRSPVLIFLLTVLLALNIYFILTLLSSQSSKPPRLHRYNHGFNTLNHPGLNMADRTMLGHDAYKYNGENDKNIGAAQFEEITAEKYSNKCIILRPKRSSMTSNDEYETPFKIYIYDSMPAALNSYLSHCVSKYKSSACFRSDHCGFGPETGTNDNGLLMHGTWQFNLEVILHHKLLARFGLTFLSILKRYIDGRVTISCTISAQIFFI